MKYTFTADGSETTVEIPDAELAAGKKNGFTTRQTIDNWLIQHGYKDGAISKPAKKTSTRKKKVDSIKQTLIYNISNYLIDLDSCEDNSVNISSVKVDNPERLISIIIDDDTYTLTLAKKRKAK